MATDTILVPGNGTGALSVQLHGPDITGVEAVLAELDTGGAGDTIATLTVTSPTGLDVAAVPQGSPVTGGDKGRATWALRLAEDGGGSAPATPLVTTDGVTTITPTTELFVADGLALGGGGGVATIAAREVPFFSTHSGPLTLTPGVAVVVDFHTGLTNQAWTNDVPAAPGYRTREGAQFDNTRLWVGDNFQGNTSAPEGAFRIRPDRPGFYIVTVTGDFQAVGGAGTLDVETLTFGAGLPRAGTFQRLVVDDLASSFAVTAALVYFTQSSSSVTEIQVLMRNNTGAANNPTNTRAEVTAYRMSPA